MYSDQPEVAWQSDDYSTARTNFLEICTDKALAVRTFEHPLKGPSGETLATDTTRIGPENASRLLVMVSGVHGVESFSGSAAQVGWLAQQQHLHLPDDTAALIVHIINPWGAAYLRRFNEDNADLCRNFMNFSKPLPVNSAYDKEHARLAPGQEMGPQAENTLEYLAARVAEQGLPATVDLFMQGQYQHSDGFGYGGSEASWSNHTLRKILESEAAGIDEACIIEYHTGLGPWAYGTLVTMHTGSDLARVRKYFGPWTVSPAEPNPGEEETFYQVTGHTITAYQESFPDSQVTAVTLEFGSYPSHETLALMLQEHILTHQAQGSSPDLVNPVRQKMLEYHHPSDWEWRCAHWTRSQQVIRQAMNTLTGSGN